MPPRGRFSQRRQQQRRAATSHAAEIQRPTRPEKKAPVEYGKPFIVMEDDSKTTFVYRGGDWVTHSMSIAECRRECQVNELAQKMRGMTRYEVRCPVSMDP